MPAQKWPQGPIRPSASFVLSSSGEFTAPAGSPTLCSIDVSGNRILLADQTARPEQQGQNENEADQNGLNRTALGLIRRRNDLGHERAARAPKSPYDQRTEQRPPVVPRPADDQHRPNLERGDGEKIERAHEPDETDVEGPGQPDDR